MYYAISFCQRSVAPTITEAENEEAMQACQTFIDTNCPSDNKTDPANVTKNNVATCQADQRVCV